MNVIPFRSRATTLSDLLPYLESDKDTGILWFKDGSASKTFQLTPKNVLSATEEDLDLIRSSLTSILNQIPENTLIQLMMVREKTSKRSDAAVQNWLNTHQGNPSKAPLAQERLFDEKLNQIQTQWNSEELYQTQIFVTARISSELLTKHHSKLGPLAHLKLLTTARKLKPSAVIAHEVEDTVNTIRMSLEAHGFETCNITDEQKVKFIFEYLNPERPFQAGSFHERVDATLSDTLTLTDLIETRSGLRLGCADVSIATMKTLPERSMPGLLSQLSTMQAEFIFTMTLLVTPQSTERERLSRKQRLMTGMASGNAVRNLSAEAQLQDIEDTLSSMISSGEKLISSSFHLVSFSSNDNAQETSHLIEQGESLGPGCQWFNETVGAYPVFFGTLPFAPSFITRPKRALSSVVSDFLPCFGIGPGHDEASVLFETPYRSAIGFSLFEKSPSANAILIGSTGSGKSTLACGLMLGMSAGRNPRAPSCFVIDVGNSFKRAVEYLGGASLDLSPEKGAVINPFDLEEGQDLPGPEKVKFLTALFDEILGESGNLSKLERSLLETEILNFYHVQGVRTLSGFQQHLSQSDAVELVRLSKLLALWCRPHPYGLLFDGETSVDLKTPHMHFELRGCQRYPDLLRVAMLVVMDLIWREVKKRFPSRSLVIVDECHTIIRPAGDGRMNTAARWVEDGFRQMRKFASAAIAISQTAKDLKNNDIGDGILANAPNRFILRQRGDEKTLREDLKLNEQELHDVFALTQLRGSYSEFFLQSESIKGVLLYRPTPLELWLSTTHPPDNALLEAEWLKHPQWSLFEIMDHMAAHYPSGAPELRESA